MQSQIRNWLLYPDINLYLRPALVLCISSDRYTLRGIVKVVVEGKKSSSYLMLQDSMRHIGELQKISIGIAQEIRIDSCRLILATMQQKKTSLFPCKLSLIVNTDKTDRLLFMRKLAWFSFWSLLRFSELLASYSLKGCWAGWADYFVEIWRNHWGALQTKLNTMQNAKETVDLKCDWLNVSLKMNPLFWALASFEWKLMCDMPWHPLSMNPCARWTMLSSLHRPAMHHLTCTK